MADITAPALLRTSPADNATGVSVTSDLTLGFSEAVSAGSGLIKIYKSDGTLFHTIAANDTAQVSVVSARVTINPSVDLLAGTSYYVVVESGAFKDLAGNNYAGLSSPTAFNFSTAGTGGANPPADTTAPLLTGTSPADNAVNVPGDANLVLTFDEAVKAGSGSFEIRNAANGQLVQSIAVTDAVKVSFSGNQVTINPGSDLLPATSYYVTFASGVVRDLANNAFSGIVSQSTFNFSTATDYTDVTAPILLFKSPTYNPYGSVSQNVVLTFNEPVKAGTGVIEIRNQADGSLYRTISVTDTSQVTFSGRSVTIDPATDLDLNRAYSVVFAPGVIEDAAGHDFDGTAVGLATFVFPGGVYGTAILPGGYTIAGNDVGMDMTLLDFEAAANGTLISVTSSRVDILGTDGLTYRFFGPDFVTTATTVAEVGGSYVGLVEVWAGSGASAHILHSHYIYMSNVASSATFDFANNLWGPDSIIGSSADDILLGYAGHDTISGREGNDVLKGGFGNDLILGGLGADTLDGEVGIDTFKFASLAELSGDVVNGFEGGDKIDLSAIAGLSFIGTNAFSGVAGQVRYASAGANTTLEIDSDGNGSSNVSLVLTGGQFVLGETQPGSKALVLTADTSTPQLVSTGPADNATGVPLNAGMSLTFSENVARGTGLIEIRRSADGSLFSSVDITSPTVTIDARTVTFGAGNWFAPDTEYYVTFGAGVIKDTVGNSFTGISSSTAFSFKTVETTPPELVTANPADNAIDVAVSANIVLVFNEPVLISGGTVTILRASDNAVFETMQVGDPRLTVSGNTVTINPNGIFSYGTQYFVSMGITDLAGNPYERFLWNPLNFTTVDEGYNIAPYIVATSPSDGATNVPISTNLVLTFNESVVSGNSGTLDIHRSSDGSVVATILYADTDQLTFSGNKLTINPIADLDPGTSYYLTISEAAIKDTSGWGFAGFSSPTTFNFTTSAAGVPPPPPPGGLTGNGFSNTLVGGTGDDVITGLGRGDTLTGGGGSDKFVYTAVSESTGRNYDTITDFNASADLIDLWFQVTGVDTALTNGSLSPWSMDSNLASAVGAAKLAGHHAVLFTPSAGMLSGKIFLIVDANGVAGYQANADLVILLGNASSLAGLTAADFV